MEGGKSTDMAAAGSGSNTGISRWNPTKEQISLLESFYMQGIRTPSADQIEQMTSRLKVYGSIEGKNVFYWFQNHKARQRQKQKQENMVYINRYLHRAPPPAAYPPLHPGPNVVCGPYFLPQGTDIGFYPQCPKVPLPAAGVKRRGRPEKTDHQNTRFYGSGAAYDLVHHDYNAMIPDNVENYDHGVINNGGSCNNISNQETLALFPLHPTVVSERRATNSAGNSTATPSSSCETTAEIDYLHGSGTEQHYLFDFFSCQGSSGSD